MGTNILIQECSTITWIDGGDGLSTGTAYQISTAQGLLALAYISSSSYVKLTANIDASLIPPAGNYLVSSFSGNFNGNGFTIFNLSSPLFANCTGSVTPGMSITNLTLSNINITATMNGTLGAVCGSLNASTFSATLNNLNIASGSITNNWVSAAENTGSVVGSMSGSMASITKVTSSANVVSNNSYTGSNVGGLVGTGSSGSISNSGYFGNLSSISPSSYNGGLIGSNSGTSISYSLSQLGSVVASGSGAFVGGLIGAQSGTVTNAYSFSQDSVSGATSGGFIGYTSATSGSTTFSFSDGNVNGTSIAGGFIGSASTNGHTFTSNFARPVSITGTTKDGFAGSCPSCALATDKFWNNSAVGTTVGAGGGSMLANSAGATFIDGTSAYGFTHAATVPYATAGQWLWTVPSPNGSGSSPVPAQFCAGSGVMSFPVFSSCY